MGNQSARYTCTQSVHFICRCCSIIFQSVLEGDSPPPPPSLVPKPLPLSPSCLVCSPPLSCPHACHTPHSLSMLAMPATARTQPVEFECVLCVVAVLPSELGTLKDSALAQQYSSLHGHGWTCEDRDDGAVGHTDLLLVHDSAHGLSVPSNLRQVHPTPHTPLPYTPLDISHFHVSPVSHVAGVETASASARRLRA